MPRQRQTHRLATPAHPGTRLAKRAKPDRGPLGQTARPTSDSLVKRLNLPSYPLANYGQLAQEALAKWANPPTNPLARRADPTR